ncbi:MAG: hypothetical protein ACLFU8_05085 [Anaerolineales bacterium]
MTAEERLSDCVGEPEVEETAPEPAPETAKEAWKDVGQQFETLGRSIADTFRAVWESEENRQHVHEIREGLKSLLHEVGGALDSATGSVEGQQIRTEAERTATSMRQAARRTWREVEPQVASALAKANDELEQVVRRMRRSSGESGATRSDQVHTRLIYPK